VDAQFRDDANSKYISKMIEIETQILNVIEDQKEKMFKNYYKLSYSSKNFLSSIKISPHAEHSPIIRFKIQKEENKLNTQIFTTDKPEKNLFTYIPVEEEMEIFSILKKNTCIRAIIDYNSIWFSSDKSKFGTTLYLKQVLIEKEYIDTQDDLNCNSYIFNESSDEDSEPPTF
jgi:hypothetical protein